MMKFEPSAEKEELPFSSRDFDPTAEELIGYYLKNHILRIPYRESGIILEETIYGEDIDPWDKFCDDHNPYPWENTSNSTSTLFLFTKLSDVGNTEKSSSIQKNRLTGCGTWHGTSSLINVTSSADEETVIGHYRILSFRPRGDEETKGQWTIYEYGISPEAFPEILNVKDWQNQVVCRIKRDDTKSNVGGKVLTKKNNKKKSPSPKPKPLPKERKSTSKPLSSRKRQTASSEEEEKKPLVVDNAQYVNQEPADQVYYGELTVPDNFCIDMDELFDGVECC